MSRDREIIYSGAPAFSLAVVQKSKTQTLVWLLARKFARAVFLDSSKSKANDLENGIASYTFFC